MTLRLLPVKIVRFLMCPVAALGVMGIAAEGVERLVQSETHRGLEVLAGKFTFAGELTVPAWFSSMLLLSAGAALGLVAWTKHCRGALYTRHWLGLAFIFVCLSIDEVVAFHEMLIQPMRRYLGASGIFSYGWVIPAAFLLSVFAGIYYQFVFQHLDSRTRRRFIAAGLIYVGSALGMEMVEGPVDEHFGGHSLPAITARTVEETLEMVGIIVFLHAVLGYLATHAGEVRIRFENVVPAETSNPLAPGAADDSLVCSRV